MKKAGVSAVWASMTDIIKYGASIKTQSSWMCGVEYKHLVSYKNAARNIGASRAARLARQTSGTPGWEMRESPRPENRCQRQDQWETAVVELKGTSLSFCSALNLCDVHMSQAWFLIKPYIYVSNVMAVGSMAIGSFSHGHWFLSGPPVSATCTRVEIKQCTFS